MGRKPKVNPEKKIEAILEYLEGKITVIQIANKYQLNVSSVKRWIRKYKTFGIEGLKESHVNKCYPSKLKEQAVLAYLNDEGSLDDICMRFQIHSNYQLSQWIMKYNSHEELKTSGTGGIKIMTKGHKTTYEERIDIVKYCIEHQNNYTETAKHFQVSYQQVYTWVIKYEKGGVEALQDNRGRRKSIEEMSELEKLKAENKLLQAENKRKQMELDFIKKLQEIERGRY